MAIDLQSPIVNISSNIELKTYQGFNDVSWTTNAISVVDDEESIK